MNQRSVDAGRRVVLTTRHGKQRALERPVQAALGASLQVCESDTDQLGSFSGEIARSADALSTCRAKALMGIEATGVLLGLASEGSFGPHPVLPMLAAAGGVSFPWRHRPARSGSGRSCIQRFGGFGTACPSS